ncbi:MAG: hypothetical protein JWR63_3679 [Conexibacter sp.]|nr:hypothetical protein [Conexibacter sp.]
MSAGTQARSWTSVWWIPVAAGLLSVIAGVLAIVWPGETLLALALIAGVNITLLSALLIGEAIADDEAQDRTLRIVLGLLGIIGGLVVMRRPGDTLLVLILALGIWLVLDGLVDVIRALVGAGPQRLLRALGGVIDIALGILILALPDVGLGTVAVLVGIGFVVRGTMLMVGGWALRSIADDLTSTGRPPAGAGGRSSPPAQPAA